MFGGCCLIFVNSHYNSILFAVFSQVSASLWLSVFWLLKSLILFGFIFLFMAINTYFHDPLNPGLVSFWLLQHFHGSLNLISMVCGPLNLTSIYSWIFMARKADFNDPLISVLDQWQFFMAMKKDFHEPWKNFHDKLMAFSEAMRIGNCNIHGSEKN